MNIIKLRLFLIVLKIIIINANQCLAQNNYSAYIPFSLVFSYGWILQFQNRICGMALNLTVKLYLSKESWLKKDDTIVPIKIVELKFLSPKLPSNISIYSMIFTVTSSVRSPAQCNKCLCYGYSSKYCKSTPRCGEIPHLIDLYSSLHSMESCCVFCKLPHIATDQNC